MGSEVKVTIISDFICPWCFLAFKQVGNAFEILRKENAEVKFVQIMQPHLLRPEHLKTPDKIYDKKEMYKRGFKNNMGKLMSYKSELVQLFSLLGVEYSMEGEVSHTLHAHRLMHYLEHKVGTSNDDLLKVAGNLFNAYHVQGKALSGVEPLLEACEPLALDETEVKEFLLSKELVNETLELIEEIPKQEVYKFTKGVPHILISIGDFNYVVPGAQETDHFVRIITKMLDKARGKL